MFCCHNSSEYTYTVTVYTENGRWFDTGLPRGYPDLFGFRHSDGKQAIAYTYNVVNGNCDLVIQPNELVNDTFVE